MSARILLVVALSIAACVPQNSPLRVTGVFSPGGEEGTKCEISTDIQSIGGSIDASGTRGYFLISAYQSDLQAIETLDSRGNVISGASRNNVLLDELVLTYTTLGANAPEVPAELQRQRRPITGTFDSDGRINVLTDMVSDSIKDFLNTSVNMGDAFILNINYYFSGSLAGGGNGNRIDTNTIDFPIAIRRDFMPCAAGFYVAPVGPCSQGGADGFPVICCDPANPTPICLGATGP